MDAPEDNRDIKLYRASADLLPEIRRRLDELLLDEQLWVADSQTQKLISLLDLFQEWPQLLDPLLLELVNLLVSTFLRCLGLSSHEELSQSPAPRPAVSLLPSAVCRILNALCKVRGVKVITRFLNNEPKYLEPMLRALLLNRSKMGWEERYIMLLWLSHLVLTPFDLQSVSSSTEDVFMQAQYSNDLNHRNRPVIAIALLSAGLESLSVAGKERESASRLVVRIGLRPDMQRLGLLEDLVKLMFTKLHDYTQKPSGSMYECLGYLSVVLGIIKSGSDDDVLPFLISTFDFAYKAMTTESPESNRIRASAPARKMLITILRTSTLHAMSLNSKAVTTAMTGDTLNGMLEGTIQCLLDGLSDRDTPVRLAASKALSMLAQRLDDDMKAEVVVAILDALEEDVLYEKPVAGDAIPSRLLTQEDTQSMFRDVTAVNPLKWQGLLLTLGHFLFRRTVPPDQLTAILKSLLSGLEFEQRSAGGVSLGGSVRDAACFGFWSLARKYGTSDLQSINPASVLQSSKAIFAATEKTSIVQIVADQLVVSACLDPSGNIRRGSSAALQELIGRHPDTIAEGIALVQVVDYHAVARRSKAMLDVARGAAELSHVYRSALLNALFGWRGVRAVDDDSRRIASAAINDLVSMGLCSDRFTAIDIAQMQLSRLPEQNTKTVVDTRHGLLLTISSVLDTTDLADIANYRTMSTSSTPVSMLLWDGVRMDGPILGSLKGNFVPELILEAAAGLVSSLVRAEPSVVAKSPERAIGVLDVCLTRADHDVALVACANAAFELLSRLPVPQMVDSVTSWLDLRGQRHSSFHSKGRILALGTIFAILPEESAVNSTKTADACRNKVFSQLTDFIKGEWPIETQVVALRSMTSTIPHLREENIVDPLCSALDNYTNDQRGDVGSLARMEAVKAVSTLLRDMAQRKDGTKMLDTTQLIVQRLFRLAGEKLDKLRFEAWKCIEKWLTVVKSQSHQAFSHVADVSSCRYFGALLRFLEIPWLQSSIVQGVAHSVSSGAEDLMRVSRLALVDSVFNPLSDYGLKAILETLVALLEDLYSDECKAAPLLETIAFVLEQQTQLEEIACDMLPTRRLWNIVRKAHFKSTNIRKLEAAVKIYGALAMQGDTRMNALGKLTDLLLHPYPIVRNAAADALYTELPNEVLVTQDWSRPPKELKAVVLRLGDQASELPGPT